MYSFSLCITHRGSTEQVGHFTARRRLQKGTLLKGGLWSTYDLNEKIHRVTKIESSGADENSFVVIISVFFGKLKKKNRIYMISSLKMTFFFSKKEREKTIPDRKYRNGYKAIKHDCHKA